MVVEASWAEKGEAMTDGVKMKGTITAKAEENGESKAGGEVDEERSGQEEEGEERERARLRRKKGKR